MNENVDAAPPPKGKSEAKAGGRKRGLPVGHLSPSPESP